MSVVACQCSILTVDWAYVLEDNMQTEFVFCLSVCCIASLYQI